MESLPEMFEQLDAPGDGDATRYSAVPVPHAQGWHVARDSRGAPAILVALENNAPVSRAVPVRLRHFAVQHDVPCTIQSPHGATKRGRFTILSCLADDPDLYQYFLHVLSAVIAALGPSPSRAGLDAALGHLITLFHALTQPRQETTRGLWAELLCIAQSPDPVTVVGAWHEAFNDRYDFNAGGLRVEVKSAAGRQRRHEFSLEQLTPPKGTTLAIASLLIESSGGGTSIGELVSEIRQQLGSHADLVQRVDSVVATLMGSDWQDALTARFDRELALQTMAFYRAEDVPQEHCEVPASVTGLRFTADLADCQPVARSALREAGGLFAAISR
ncbi:MAG TPA: hypothetical protein DEV93_04495 [Chloroflexi bacterium]|jgi:hypothetical protein|nr:hypothetical protein [Chloroflexota bacterium]